MPEPVRATKHQAPPGVSEETVQGVGRLSEAFEYVERARGHLYSFHQLMGRADFLVEEAAGLLRGAGQEQLASRLETELIGRNVLDGRWTFQVVEEYDETYYDFFRQLDKEVTDELMGGVRHVYEARLKERRRSQGRPGHEADPQG